MSKQLRIPLLIAPPPPQKAPKQLEQKFKEQPTQLGRRRVHVQEAKPCALQLAGRSQDSFHQVMLFCPFAPALHPQEPRGSICLPWSTSQRQGQCRWSRPLGPGASSKAASWGIIQLPSRKSPRTPEDPRSLLGQTAACASVSPRGAALKARGLMTRSLPSTSPPSPPAALGEGGLGAPTAPKTPRPVLALRGSRPGRGPRRWPGWAWRAAAGPART